MEVTESESRDVRTILIAFYGRQADAWPINSEVIRLVGEMLTKNRRCAEAIGLVPRPGIVDHAYLRRQLARIARGILAGDKSYLICERYVALSMKSQIHWASQAY